MKRKSGIIIASVLFLFFACSLVQAEMQRVYLDVKAQTIANQDGTTLNQMSFWVTVADNTTHNPPDYVQSVVVRAPNGDTFVLTTKDNWAPFMRAYMMGRQAPTFSGGVIPAGNYSVEVTDTSLRKLTARDTVSPVAFLAPVTITQPVQDSVILADDLMITWGAVPGAKEYTVGLWDTSSDMPVILNFPDPSRSVRDFFTFTQLTHFKLPKGMLHPNRSYRVNIVAYAGDGGDNDKQSHSKSINFTTGAW
jgi:hypothetical protein